MPHDYIKVEEEISPENFTFANNLVQGLNENLYRNKGSP
jgi:hypothetical protein